MLVILALAAAPAAAQEFQPTAALDTIVVQFTGKNIGQEGGARTEIDKRLRLARCPAPQLEWRSPAHDAVLVRCMAPAWRIFVPVIAVPQPKPAPVAAAPAPAVVKAEPVIRRGDPVTVEVGSAGFSVTRDGVAMNDAAPGARIAVKVDDRQPPLQAIAVEPGRARLPGAK
ncbi:MAG: flagella basal body P-ring formation protein FlgA [Sphingomonas sp.]|uniref:flagella basal body P-ring formation protein FlgA n=1 Tax=Sphingomonas sp. TaxID=28214 RepID=UPI001B12033D|nr:flagella basal body P-ring formation protein FlgA [Sphingomonas sp.]MBO9622018.1 flagella basal body P-ring formation protein FlgA [Sphingomonas sp.]